ncbi:hypothetical protein AtDm6_0299 [Acetobacter tropicalis]|uniref:Uncharacterized protein n=1 Tax=Acetobacter tropicalis TaxID=104102 RepID=A0A094YY67_9PROT|nr:hypothetical protein AtDm6_0299 [Acetobacter tropicalis]
MSARMRHDQGVNPNGSATKNARRPPTQIAQTACEYLVA